MSERRYYTGPEGELVRADFDADGALIDVTEYVPGPVYEVHDEEQEEEAEEDTVVPPPVAKPRKEKVKKPKEEEREKTGGREAKYDVTALRQDILEGLPVNSIALKHGVTAMTVYAHRSKMKAEGENVPAGNKPASTLTKDQIEEIRQRRADGETTSEIAAVMELDSEAVASVKADMRLGKGDRNPASIETQEEKIQKMVAQGCGVGEVMMMFPYLSEKQAEEAVAWAMHNM